jgi:hypothetical protein
VRVAIHQPNYLPWCGFFAKVASSDVLLFLDDAQMPLGRSYVSRTSIRDGDGARWLSVPVARQAGQAINEVRLAEPGWGIKHLRSLRHAYGKAPSGGAMLEVVEPILSDPGTGLADLNMRLIRAVLRFLDIEVETRLASALDVHSRSDERLVELTLRVGGSTYVSGAGGQNYQHEERFAAAGLELDVRRYDPIAYAQGSGAFVPGLSIVDALAQLGPDARTVLRYG